MAVKAVRIGLPVQVTSAPPIRALEFRALPDRALVIPENRRAKRCVPWPKRHRAVHLPGQPDRIGRRDAIQKRPTGDAQSPPPYAGVLFRPPCHGRLQRIGSPDRPDDPAELIDEDRLQTRRPEVEPDRVQQATASPAAMHLPNQ